MKKYEIAIVVHNLLDALNLRDIILKQCNAPTEVSCFITLNDAINNFKRSLPDVVILDLSMREEIHFSIYKTLNDSGVKIVFLSDQNKDHFKDTIGDFQCLYKPINEKSVEDTLRNMLSENFKINVNDDKDRQTNIVAIHSVHKTDFVDMREIIFCAADGKYTTFHLSNGAKIISSKNLGTYEKMLNHLSFFRVHHAYIVNINYLRSIIKNDGFFCKLINNINVPVAKRKQGDFNRFLRLN